MPLWQDQISAVVSDEFESPVLVAVVPPDPAVTRGALQSRGGKTQQRRPLPINEGNVPQRVADLGQVAQVVVLLHQFAVAWLLATEDRTNGYLLQIKLHSPLYTWVNGICPAFSVACMILIGIVVGVNSP